MYDIAIIGAGVIGCSIARELSKYELKTVVIEKNPDISWGTSKANSGIVHAGYDPEPGTMKAKMNVEGAKLYPSIVSELSVPYKETGTLVVAFDEEQEKSIEELKKRGEKNGVREIEIIDRDKVMELEPRLNPDIKLALYAKNAAIVSPYEFTIALAENAMAVISEVHGRIREKAKISRIYVKTTMGKPVRVL